MVENDVLEKPLAKEYNDIFSKFKPEEEAPAGDGEQMSPEDVAFIANLNKRTGKEFKTVAEADEFLKAPAQQQAPATPPTPEEIAEAEEKEYVNYALNQKNLKVEELTKFREMEKKSPADFAMAALGEKLRAKNPSISAADIEKKFRQLYFVNAEGETLFDDEEIAIGKARMEAEGKRYQETLLKPYLESRNEFSNNKSAVLTARTWNDKVEKTIESAKEFLIPFNDKEKTSTKIVLDENMNKVIKPLMQNPYQFFNEMVNGADGKLDPEKLHALIVKVSLFDKIVGEAKSFGQSVGHDGVAENFRNASKPIIDASPSSANDGIDGKTIGR